MLNGFLQYRYLDADAFAFILEYDSEEVVDEDIGEVGGEIESGFPQPELSVDDPEVTTLVCLLWLLWVLSPRFVVDASYDIE